MRKIYIFIARAALCPKMWGNQTRKLKAPCHDLNSYTKPNHPEPLLKERAGGEIKALSLLSLSQIKLEWLKRRSHSALIFLFLSVAVILPARAQTMSNEIKPPKIGDKLPESFWQQTHWVYRNGKTTRQTLAAYKDKLLILDFWATWCGSCLKKFAMADSLQKEYGDTIAIVLVNAANTRDTEDKIAPAMLRYNMQLSTIIADTTLTRMFPHAVVPHYIWIEQGQYRAATGTEFFTREGIAASVDRRKYLDKVLAKLKQQMQ